jgi:hypothetical protein
MTPTMPYINYPRISVELGHVNSTVASLAVKMKWAGYLYCAAYPAKHTIPTGAALKTSTLAVSSLVTTDRLNVTVALRGLSALTNYSAFCYTEDMGAPPAVMPNEVVALTRRNLSTPCCHALSGPTMPTTLYALDTSAALTIVSPIAARVNVTIVSAHYAAIQSVSGCTASALAIHQGGNKTRSLTIRPSRTVSFYKSTTAAFTLSARMSGCYYVQYNLTGPHKALFTAPPATALFIYEPGAPKAAPTLSSVRFSSTGSSLEVTLSGSSDRAGLSGVFGCSSLVQFAGVGSSTCSWFSSSLLTVTLDSSATLLPGDAFTLLGSRLKAECVATNRNCTAWAFSAAESVGILGPAKPLLPSVQAAYSGRIGACSELTIDASAASGSGGRAMVYRWTVASSTGNDLSNVTAYFNTTANVGNGLRSIRLPGDYIRVRASDAWNGQLTPTGGDVTR